MYLRLTANGATFSVITLLIIILLMVGCWDKPRTAGFFVITEDCGVDEFGVPFCIPHPFVKVNGQYVRDIDNTAVGDVYSFPTGGSGFVTTDGNGHIFVTRG